MARVTSGCVCVCAMQVQLCPRRAGAGPAVVRLPNVGVRPSLTSVRSVRLCLSLRFHCFSLRFHCVFTAFHCLSLLVTACHCLSRPFTAFQAAFPCVFTAYHCVSLLFTAFQAAFPCDFTAYHCLSLLFTAFHCLSSCLSLRFHCLSLLITAFSLLFTAFQAAFPLGLDPCGPHACLRRAAPTMRESISDHLWYRVGQCVARVANMGHQLAGGDSRWRPQPMSGIGVLDRAQRRAVACARVYCSIVDKGSETPGEAPIKTASPFNRFFLLGHGQLLLDCLFTAIRILRLLMKKGS